MPEKRLIAHELVAADPPPPVVRWLFAPGPEAEHRWYDRSTGIEWPHECGVCTLGALGLRRGVDLTDRDPEDHAALSADFNIAAALVQETEWVNDEAGPYRGETPEQRWTRMRAWAVSNLKPEKLPESPSPL
jgi:hypothetical protein